MAKAASTKAPAKANVLFFDFERDTKNTYRYAERGDEPVIGTVYMRKSAFQGERPDSIKVTVESA